MNRLFIVPVVHETPISHLHAQAETLAPWPATRRPAAASATGSPAGRD